MANNISVLIMNGTISVQIYFAYLSLLQLIFVLRF